MFGKRVFNKYYSYPTKEQVDQLYLSSNPFHGKYLVIT